MVYKLHKALYGLKQAPRAWNQKIDSFFKKQGFQKCEMEYGVYVKHSGSNMIIVCLYVDDILLMGSCNHKKKSADVLMKDVKTEHLIRLRDEIGVVVFDGYELRDGVENNSYPELLRGVRSSEVLMLSEVVEF